VLVLFWYRCGLIVAHDEGRTIAALVDEMSRKSVWLPIIAFAEDPRPQRIVNAVLSGAVDFIAWPFDRTHLSDAIDMATARGNNLSTAKLREISARGRLERLTRREREVLNCVAEGLSSRRIGEKLAISPRTVEIHRANMLNKIGAHSTSEAIRVAVEASLTQ
jgi:FixJ family two-component response regulator